MQVTAKQIRRSINAKYTLWSGEIIVRVVQHTGLHGFHSAVVVIDRLDDPLEVRTKNWYTKEAQAAGKPVEPMLEWIAAQLTELSTGTELNEGACGDVAGLLVG